jgi:hypothetical protein
MLFIDRPRQHDNLARATRYKSKPLIRRADASHCPKRPAKPPNLDSQARAMRFVGESRSERSCKEQVSRHVSWPRLAQRSCEREQYRAIFQRNDSVCFTHDIAACVHDERFRCQQIFDIFEQEESILTIRNQARRWLGQDERCVFNLRRQRRDAGSLCGAHGTSEGCSRCFRLNAPYSDSRNYEFVGSPPRGREGRGVEFCKHPLCLLQAPDQEEASDLEMQRVRGVQPVAVLFERHPRCVERLRRPAQVAGDERDFGLGHDAPRAGHGFFWTEGARRTSQESLRSCEIAELRHRDASKR